MRLYATSADAWPETGTAPSNADLLLRAASRVVDHLLRGVVYDTDTAGLPTDPDVTTALRDATVAITLESEAVGLGTPGNTQQWESVQIGNVALSTLQDGSASDSLTVAGIPVPPLALTALADVGRRVVVVL